MAAIRLKPRLVEKLWGCSVLPAGFPDPSGRMIGEIIHEGEISDPILVKHIFTSERLSIQVHPNDEQARSLDLPSGKSECWLILTADPGATIGIGGRRPVDASTLRKAAEDGSIAEWLDWKVVAAGDFLMVPAGTIHAIGGGIGLVEIQQNVDVTYRLYDYGRERELQLDAGLDVADAGPWPSQLGCRVRPGAHWLVENGAFRVRHLAESGINTVGQCSKASWLVPLSDNIRLGGVTAMPGECWRIQGKIDVELGRSASLLEVHASK